MPKNVEAFVLDKLSTLVKKLNIKNTVKRYLVTPFTHATWIAALRPAP